MCGVVEYVAVAVEFLVGTDALQEPGTFVYYALLAQLNSSELDRYVRNVQGTGKRHRGCYRNGGKRTRHAKVGTVDPNVGDAENALGYRAAGVERNTHELNLVELAPNQRNSLAALEDVGAAAAVAGASALGEIIAANGVLTLGTIVGQCRIVSSKDLAHARTGGEIAVLAGKTAIGYHTVVATRNPTGWATARRVRVRLVNDQDRLIELRRDSTG